MSGNPLLAPLARAVDRARLALVAALLPAALSAQDATQRPLATGEPALAAPAPAVSVPAAQAEPAAVSPDAPRPAGSVMHAGAPIAGARVVHQPSPEAAPRAEQDAPLPLEAQQERRVGAGRNVAMMIVGAAGVLTGLLIGGDGGALVAVGGAVVGLYGLYQYLR
jgi:hypothetical protein